MEMFSNVLGQIDGFVWGIPMIVFLLGTHIYMTFKTGFIQRKVFQAIKISISGDPSSEGDVSQFGALATSLAATIGTGNIIGVGTAIALGGPGAVLWTWIGGIFGMATKYMESLMAIKYRVKSTDGRYIGGAMFAIERGTGKKWFAMCFAVLASLAAFGIGCSVQSNAVATTLNGNFGVPNWATAVVIGVATIAVIFGGIKSISRVAEKLVPTMALLYVIGCIAVMVINSSVMGETIMLILKSAFTPQAFGGGMIGAMMITVMRFGVARGLFSNESGMGSAPMVAASAMTRNPARQALVSMTATFWDTVIICLLTGLAVVSTIVIDPTTYMLNGTFVADAGLLTSQAFSRIPFIGTPLLAVAIVLFCFSTILGWEAYGERAGEYAMGERSITPYRIVYTIVAVFGCLIPLDLAWLAADILNGLMIIPNVLAMYILQKGLIVDTKYYVYDDHIEDWDMTPIPQRNTDGSLPAEAFGKIETVHSQAYMPEGAIDAESIIAEKRRKREEERRRLR